MPNILKNITGIIYDNNIGDIYVYSQIETKLDYDDYISVYGFYGYMQNFSRVTKIEKIIKPISFGLKNQYNQPTIDLEISY